MILKTTDIGIEASIDYSNGDGPAPDIQYFRVGSDINVAFPPPVLPSNQSNGTSATGVYGSIPNPVDPGLLKITTYRKVSPDTMEYTLRMDNSIGDFNFGNIGIYTVNPSAGDVDDIKDSAKLFAIGTFNAPVWKEKTATGTAGNIIEFIVRVSFGGATVVIDFTINPVTSAILLELNSVDSLNSPTLAESNVYLVRGNLVDNPLGLTDNGNSFLAIKKDNFYWSFDEYSKVVDSGVVDTSTITSFTSTSLPFLDYAPGRFLVQFLDGPHQGVVRAINSITANTISWFTSTGAPVDVGTSYEIICSNFYALGSSKITPIDSVDLLPRPEATDVTIYNVNGTLLSPFGRDDKGNGFLVFLNSSDKQQWAFSNYKLPILNNISIDSSPSNPNPTNLESTAIGTQLGNFSTGRYIARFGTGANRGLVRVVSAQAANQFSWVTPLPNPISAGDRVTVFQSDAYSFGSGSSGGQPGEFQVETIVSTGTTVFNLTLVNANYAIPFVGDSFQDPSEFTVNSPTQITFGFTIPDGTRVHFLEVAKGVATNGVPIGGAINSELIKTGINDYEVQWVSRTGRIEASLSTVEKFGTLYCDGRQLNISDFPQLFNELNPELTAGNWFPVDGIPVFTSSGNPVFRVGDRVKPSNQTSYFYIHPHAYSLASTTTTYTLSSTKPEFYPINEGATPGSVNLRKQPSAENVSGNIRINLQAHDFAPGEWVSIQGLWPAGVQGLQLNGGGPVINGTDLARSYFIVSNYGYSADSFYLTNVFGGGPNSGSSIYRITSFSAPLGILGAISLCCHGSPVVVPTFTLIRLARTNFNTLAFTLLDLRGVTLKGWDPAGARGFEFNRALGSYLSDMLGGHGHTVYAEAGGISRGTGQGSQGDPRNVSTSVIGGYQNRVKDFTVKYFIYY